MANVICIAGESGTGKTTSMRNLDPTETLYIDCDKKGLSWKGWRSQYNADNKNYVKTDFPSVVMQYLQYADKHENGQRFKVVVVDTLNGIMVADEMRRCKEKGYDKWQDMAQSIYDIVDYALVMRDDLTVIFVAHAQTERNDDGYQFTRIKTSGRKLDKITLESKFTTVLMARCVDGSYVFETQANNSTAKSPMGLLETREIPNDIKAVVDALREF